MTGQPSALVRTLGERLNVLENEIDGNQAAFTAGGPATSFTISPALPAGLVQVRDDHFGPVGRKCQRAGAPDARAPTGDESCSVLKQHGCAHFLGASYTPGTTGGELHAVWSAYSQTNARRLFYARRQPVVRHTVFIPIVMNEA